MTPFVVLLLAIAVMPLVAAKFWHHWYPQISIALGLVVAGYYLVRGEGVPLLHVGFEYLGFITLIACLFLCTGGVVLRLGWRGTPWTNAALLLAGAILANLIGTTGASMLLIRPFLRLNHGRLRPYHVAFFIFFVANCGGALTPIGDPPLLLGYLRGIDFFRFFHLNLGPWAMVMALLTIAFVLVDLRNKGVATPQVAELAGHHQRHRRVEVKGFASLGLLAVALGCVFLDPNRISWVPGLGHDAMGWRLVLGGVPGGEVFSFIREILLLGIGVLAYRIAPRRNLVENGFTFEPLREVALLFIGIFMTMLPALELIRADTVDGTLGGIPLDPLVFYLGTGVFSSVLDNAPTFIAFLAGMEGKFGLSVRELGLSAVPEIARALAACATASVFFGAMTYIGNGPNFMVKSIAESARDDHGQPYVQVPSFFGYIVRFALPILLPILLFVGWFYFL